LFDTRLTEEELCSLASELGADVPYCLLGGTYLAEGVGEELTRLADAPKMYVVLVKPPVSVSTAMIYEEIDNAEILDRPDTDAMIKALERGSVADVSAKLCNVMEAVTVKKHPVIAEIKERLLECGASNAIMSGSGPTVFGLFDDYDKARMAVDAFADFKEVFLTNIKNC